MRFLFGSMTDMLVTVIMSAVNCQKCRLKVKCWFK